jgi:hypothetical protein
MIPFRIKQGLFDNLPTILEEGTIYYCIDKGLFCLDIRDVNGVVSRKILRGVGEDVSGEYFIVKGIETLAQAGAETFNDYENNIAIGPYSHAEGSRTKALGDYSHTEGYYTEAAGDYSHAEGKFTTASGNYSHVEGNDNEAKGDCSHAEGEGTKASGAFQHVQGKYNIEDTEDRFAHIVGNGEYNMPSNIHTLDW